MRGRKPQANAVRRGGKAAVELVPSSFEQGTARTLDKPPAVACVPAMSDLWDALAGSGIAYTEQDAPFIEQLVFDLELARQCREKVIDANGNIIALIGKGEPDEDGTYLDMKPNPWIKQMRDATMEALKLADQLGCTQLARARLGLTLASGAANLSIAKRIDAALERGAL